MVEGEVGGVEARWAVKGTVGNISQQPTGKCFLTPQSVKGKVSGGGFWACFSSTPQSVKGTLGLPSWS